MRRGCLLCGRLLVLLLEEAAGLLAGGAQEVVQEQQLLTVADVALVQVLRQLQDVSKGCKAWTDSSSQVPRSKSRSPSGGSLPNSRT